MHSVVDRVENKFMNNAAAAAGDEEEGAAVRTLEDKGKTVPEGTAGGKFNDEEAHKFL